MDAHIEQQQAMYAKVKQVNAQDLKDVGENARQSRTQRLRFKLKLNRIQTLRILLLQRIRDLLDLQHQRLS